MVICLERGADLRMAQLMPLPLTVSCFSRIQIGFTFLVLAYPVSPGKRAVKWVCVCSYVRSLALFSIYCVSKVEGGTLSEADVQSICRYPFVLYCFLFRMFDCQMLL